MKGRIKRLYPAAWICASITALALLAGPGAFDGSRYASSLLLNPFGPWVSGVYWTLGVEVVFYALVALTIAFAGSKHLFALAMLLAFWSVGYWSIRIAQDVLYIDLGLPSAFGGQYEYLTLVRSGCYFALGICLWRATRFGWSLPTLVVALACTGAGIISTIGAGQTYLANDPSSAAPVWLPVTIWLVSLAAIFLSVRFAKAVNSQLLPASGLIRDLGLATYPLYLVHSELGRNIMLAMPNWHPGVVLTITVAMLVGLSIVVVKVEKYPRAVLVRVIGGQASQRNKTAAAALP